MKRFEVTRTFKVEVTLEVVADSEEEAKKVALQTEFDPGDYEWDHQSTEICELTEGEEV